MITITRKEYITLLQAREELNRLNSGGVDNWEWYSDSLNPDGEDSLDDVFDSIRTKVEAMPWPYPVNPTVTTINAAAKKSRAEGA